MTPLIPIPSVSSRDVLADNFTAIGRFFRDHPDAIAPSEFKMQIPVPKGLDQPAKVAWIHGIAASWHTDVVADGDGTLTCEVRAGRVAVCASVAPTGSRHIVRRLDDLDQCAPSDAAIGRVA